MIQVWWTIFSITTNQSPVLRPLYRSTCTSRHLQLRTGGFYWCKVLLPAVPAYPCWRQPAHSDYGEDAGVLRNSVIYTVSTPHLFSITKTSWTQSIHQTNKYAPQNQVVEHSKESFLSASHLTPSEQQCWYQAAHPVTHKHHLNTS